MSKTFPTPFRNVSEKGVPRRKFVGGPAFQRGQVSVTVAPGGSGKSALTVAEAITLSNGNYLFGERKEVNARVWLINAEDDGDELQRRLIAAVGNHIVVPEALEQKLFVDHLERSDIQIARAGRNGPEENKQVYANLKAAILDKIDVVIIDPFIMTHSVNENDNIGIDFVVRTWKKLALETDAAIHLVHHTRKEKSGEITADSSRGAASLHDAVRYLRTLNKLRDSELESKGYHSSRSIVQIKEAKSNYSRLAEPDYFEIISYKMENGDDVGVAILAEKTSTPESKKTQKKLSGSPDTATRKMPTPAELDDIALFTDSEMCRVSVTNRDWLGKYVKLYFGLNMRKDREWIELVIQKMLSLKLIHGIMTPYGGHESEIYKRPSTTFSGRRIKNQIIRTRDEMLKYIEAYKPLGGS